MQTPEKRDLCTCEAGAIVRELLEEFFEVHQSESSEELLWKMLEAAMASEDMEYWPRLDRANALGLVRALNKFIMEMELMHQLIVYPDKYD